jgi:HK97 family phage major capsid protein
MYATQESTLIQKADFRLSQILSPNGELEPAQSRKFIQIMTRQSSFLNLVNVQTMKARKQQVNKIKFGAPILRAGTEGQALSLADRSTPDTTATEFDAKLFKCEVNITQESLEDNIEDGDFLNTLLMMISTEMVANMENLVINSDTASVDPNLAKFDGMLKSATSNVIDALGATFDQNVADAMIKTMPVEFRKRVSEQRFFLDHNSEQNARNSNATRATNAGDSNLENNDSVKWFGRALLPADYWPSNLGGGFDDTAVILAHLSNVGVGIWRGITIKRDTDNRSDTVSWIGSCRIDFKYLEETAVVKAINVQSL